MSLVTDHPATEASAAAGPEVAARAAPLTGLPSEFLSFRLGAEEYGIDILRVQEIRSYEEPTRIANAPDIIKGVVNLRGVIVPVVDLRLMLGCDRAEFNEFTVVIVLNVRGHVIGTVVDSVSDVLALTPAQIRPAPEMGHSVDASAITGIACVSQGDTQRMLILTDIEALLGSPALGLVSGPLH